MSKVQGAPVLKVKRYAFVADPDLSDEGNYELATMEITDGGEFVKASEVKSAIRQMAKSHRLTPETATRIIESLAL